MRHIDFVTQAAHFMNLPKLHQSVNRTPVNDLIENQWIQNTFEPQAFGTKIALWIGLHDPSGTGSFEWISGEAFSFSNWFIGEPNNIGAEQYVQTVGSEVGSGNKGKWNNIADVAVNGDVTFYGVVEIVPEPTTSMMVLLAALIFTIAFTRKFRRGREICQS